MPNITNIPAPRVPLIDQRTGLISREWFRFFQNLFTLTGSGSTDVSVSDLQLSPGDVPGLQAALETLTGDVEDLRSIPVIEHHADFPRYGSFYDTTTQNAAAINTAYAITFNTTDLSKGVYIGSPTSRIYVDRPGIFNFQFSAQLDKTSSNAKSVWIWARINGTNVANSATEVTLQGNSAAAVAAWNFVYQMAAGDYFELMWSTDDTGCQIAAAAAAGPYPAIPSVIMTVTDNISR